MLIKPENRARLSAAVLAVGLFMPDAGQAAPVSLGDPSFEDYALTPFPAGTGYAYSNQYRPTSAWVDDLDHFAGYYVQDDGKSNWLYNSGYAEGASTARKRASPRTGSQAMHGFGYYNAQETGAVFEAQMTYTFSLWAQGDDDATTSSSRVFLYLFDGSIPFSEANSLKFARYGVDTGDFFNRPVGVDAAASQGLWREIRLSHTVLPGAPEIGHPVGVGFWIAADGAVDDAALTVNAVPEPGAAALLSLGAMGLLTRRRRCKEHGP